MIWIMHRRRRKHTDTSSPFKCLVRLVRWSFYLLLLVLIVDAFYIALIWPDWDRLAVGPVPKSRFISNYQHKQRRDRELPALRWQPVTLADIPTDVVRAVVVAEDSRFYQHHGFDFIAFKDAMNYNLAEGRFVLGASTISQQTTKNLFLSSARNPLRKWHELILTWGMERRLKKRRILELYLNIAEFGPGIYGVQAASYAYWGVPVSTLTLDQAVAVAASLPSPKKHNANTRTERFKKRVVKVTGFMRRYDHEWHERASRRADGL
ncbi:MAG: monofunctional biosynthetic peptidoglycan transglycosylase [Proteobacteria bacterium]|nr:monofunctional biosynthetic peptidoglycan transglycosylase [Pseudomonadota bacterium]